MEQTQHKKVGIIGGMGPLATADLFEKITHLTKADADSKHIHVIIDSDTSIPDRTAAILGLGPDPTDELKAAAKRLENAGADILLMPCNTAHYFYPLTFRHWAGVSPYTSSFDFAETCVFDKQLLGPLHCDHIAVAPLLPKLRGHFAEFLNKGSPVRL